MTFNPVCPHCGEVHKATARFCPKSGKPIPQMMMPTQAPAAAGVTGRLPANYILNNRYLIIQKIGQGGMAAIYQTTDVRQPGTVWAVKEMSDSAITNPGERIYAVQCFQQEADLLRQLNHPCLPKVVDCFTEGGKHYLVMEFIPGSTLEDMLAKRGMPFSEQDVTQWAKQLCDVLSYLHCQNPPIIFRDIKPGNIMIMPNGQLRLIDFGIVRFFKPGKTKDTQALGTPGYNAPEAARGQTDARSDIYSMCVTLHQLLTNYDPLTSLFNLPPVRQINPAISPGMEQIIKVGTELQREKRWASALDMKAALIQLEHSIMGYQGASAAGPMPGVGMRAPGAGPVRRPTTRLIMAASHLSPVQLLLAGGGLLAGMVILTAVLAPVMYYIPINWNNIPIMALFGALAYAAYPKRGSVFVAHTVLSSAVVLTIWLRLGQYFYSFPALIAGALVSGIVMEIWVAFINKVKGSFTGDPWVVEAGWLAAMEVIGMILFFGILTALEEGLSPVLWFFAALIGAGGWFLGDLVQQYNTFRQTGQRRI